MRSGETRERGGREKNRRGRAQAAARSASTSSPLAEEEEGGKKENGRSAESVRGQRKEGGWCLSCLTFPYVCCLDFEGRKKRGRKGGGREVFRVPSLLILLKGEEKENWPVGRRGFLPAWKKRGKGRDFWGSVEGAGITSWFFLSGEKGEKKSPARSSRQEGE